MDGTTGYNQALIRAPRRTFLLALVILGTTCALLAILGPTVWLRALGGLPLVLVLPGAALTACVLTDRSQNNQDLWLLVPALSIVVTILVGTALAASHVFSATSLATLLGATSVAPAAWKAVTTPRTGKPDARPNTPRPRNATVLATSVLFFCILTAALALGAVTEHQSALRATSFALWARTVPDGVVIGLTPQPQRPVTVDVEVTRAGRLVAAWREVTLKPGTMWSQTLSAPTGRLPESLPLVVRVVQSGRVVREIPVYSHPNASGS